jgi:hypothetical protein
LSRGSGRLVWEAGLDFSYSLNVDRKGERELEMPDEF